MPSRTPNSQVGRTSARPVKEFPGVTHYKDRHGKLRWRYRSKGFTANLGTEYGSPEFLRRYTAAVKGERLTQGEAQSQRVTQAPQGSLSHVINSWYQSPEFTALGETTKKNYTRAVENLRDEHGSKLVKGITRPVVRKLMAQKADTPAAANYLRRILCFLLDHAMNYMEIIDHNPARDVKNYQTKNPEGFHTWTETEIDRFYKRWELGTTADLAMTLMLYTGAARSDAVQLGPDNVSDGRIRYERQKMKSRGGVVVDIPIHPDLAVRLDRLTPDLRTFLETEAGRERSPNGLGNSMRKWANAAGLPDCTAHGLRKACARRLAEAGATPHEIMAVTGHKTLAEVERYTSKVTRASLADSAMEKQIHEADLAEQSG